MGSVALVLGVTFFVAGLKAIQDPLIQIMIANGVERYVGTHSDRDGITSGSTQPIEPADAA